MKRMTYKVRVVLFFVAGLTILLVQPTQFTLVVTLAQDPTATSRDTPVVPTDTPEPSPIPSDTPVILTQLAGTPVTRVPPTSTPVVEEPTGQPVTRLPPTATTLPTNTSQPPQPQPTQPEPPQSQPPAVQAPTEAVTSVPKTGLSNELLWAGLGMVALLLVANVVRRGVGRRIPR